MPIPLEYEEQEENQQPSDFLISQLTTVLEYGVDKSSRVDAILFDVTLEQIDEYMEKVKHDQDLPFPLTRIRSKEINNQEIFESVCNHCNITSVEYNPTKIYFVETASNAVVLIPIQLEKGVVNICIELLDKEITSKEIYGMYMGLGKLRMDQIKFVKFTN